VGKLEGRSQLGRLSRRWDDKIKMKQIWWGNLKEGVNLEDIVVDGIIRIK